MLTSDYISRSVFPKNIQKPVSFIQIKKENRTKRTFYTKTKRKYVEEPICALIPKQISKLKKKYKDILQQNIIQPKLRISEVYVSTHDKSFTAEYVTNEDEAEYESVKSIPTIQGSQLYSPVFSPLFPSPRRSIKRNPRR